MPYESLDPRTMLPATPVVWGPFPLRWARLLSGLATFALALMMVFLGLQHQRLYCARSGVLAGQCEWQTGIGTSPGGRFPLVALRSVRVVYSETSNKGHITRWGQLMIDIKGREWAVTRQTADTADASAAALQKFLHDPVQDEVRFDTGRSLAMLGIGALFALGGAALLYSVWQGRRRFRFTWDASLQQLSRQTQWPLGVVRAPPTVLSLRDPVEVEVRWEEVTDPFTSARSPGPRGARLQVRLASGSKVDLWPRPMRGYRVHRRAAEELRSLLRCPPASAAAAASIAASYEAERPRLGPGWTGIGGRIAATWLGACCGSVLGIAGGGILAILLGFAKPSDNADGPWFSGGMMFGVVGGVALAWRILLRPDER